MKALQSMGVNLVFALIFGLGLSVSVGQAQSGSLEPPGSAVNGSGDPVATTQTQPSWDQSLPANERFVRVLPTAATPAGEGVLDKETGLVWEQSPLGNIHNWSLARRQCMSRTVGGKKGWRLPSVHEMASLFDPTISALPTGHPFSSVVSNILVISFWSATTNIAVPTEAWLVLNSNGAAIAVPKAASFTYVWCVRGGSPGPSVY